MTKGERLIWELFEMVRELMPPTAANAERFQKWSEKFHEMEVASEDSHQPVDVADADEDEPGADPHEHGVPTRRKKRR
jgi:hypothetical protein